MRTRGSRTEPHKRTRGVGEIAMTAVWPRREARGGHYWWRFSTCWYHAAGQSGIHRRVCVCHGTVPSRQEGERRVDEFPRLLPLDLAAPTLRCTCSELPSATDYLFYSYFIKRRHSHPFITLVIRISPLYHTVIICSNSSLLEILVLVNRVYSSDLPMTLTPSLISPPLVLILWVFLLLPFYYF